MIFTLRGKLIATLAVACTAAVLVTGVASAASRGAHATASGSTLVASFTFDVRNDGGRPSGYFTATPTPPANLLIALQGPATCVDIEGNKVGFIYPIQDGSRPDAIKGMGVLVSAVDNGPGNTDFMGFVGPLPLAAFHGCAPGLAPLAIKGDVTVDGAS